MSMVETEPHRPDDIDTGARALLYDLVSTPSVSGDEAVAADRLVAFFEAHGREVFVDAVGNVRAPANDAALLTSHIDTVPGEIPVAVRDGADGPELWGRGSVDATGPLAAMAAAAVETGVSFVGVVGEETDSRGAWHLIEDREAPDAVINGEPSGTDGITLGYRGILSGRYESDSPSGHTSRPDPNAIQHAMAWWNAVAEAFAVDDETGVFDHVTAKPVAVDGGVSDDGLAVETTMDVQFRIPPRLTVDEVRTTVESMLEIGTVDWSRPIPPVMTSPRTALARAFRVAIRSGGGDPRLLRKTGTADMNIYASAWDRPMVTYGPGDSDLDHAPNEHLPLAEFDRSIAVLTDVCERVQQ
ncbi:[LysW]-lysine hydrolase [Haloferacaceae archaeon DSL9]